MSFSTADHGGFQVGQAVVTAWDHESLGKRFPRGTRATVVELVMLCGFRSNRFRRDGEHPAVKVRTDAGDYLLLGPLLLQPADA